MKMMLFGLRLICIQHVKSIPIPAFLSAKPQIGPSFLMRVKRGVPVHNIRLFFDEPGEWRLHDQITPTARSRVIVSGN